MKTRIFSPRSRCIAISLCGWALAVVVPGTVFAAVIVGTVWEDLDGDGRSTTPEPPLAGVIVYVDFNDDGVFDPGEPSVVSSVDVTHTPENEGGTFRFSNAPPGRVVIRAVVPDRFVESYPTTGHVVELLPTDQVRGIDFGFQSTLPGSIGGRVWHDGNQDGLQESFEPGLAGVTIYVDLDQDCVWDRDEPFAVTSVNDPFTLEDELGLFEIEDLDPGPVTLRQVMEPGHFPVSPAGGQAAILVPGNAHLPGVDFANGIATQTTMTPERFDLILDEGETLTAPATYAFAPYCIYGFDVDAIPSDPAAGMTNLSGVVGPNCGGIVSNFEFEFAGAEGDQCFHVEFVEPTNGKVVGSIPVRIVPEPTGTTGLALMLLLLARHRRARRR